MEMTILKPKTMLILFDGYWNAVLSEKLLLNCHYIGNGALKVILLSADLVMSGSSPTKPHVQFLIDVKYLLRIRAWFHITETAQAEHEKTDKVR